MYGFKENDSNATFMIVFLADVSHDNDFRTFSLFVERVKILAGDYLLLLNLLM